MKKEPLDFIQTNSPDGGFLQSEYWQRFQESVGRKTHNISEANEDGKLVAYANVIEHTLPIAGKYFYIPRGPIIENSKSNLNDKIYEFLNDLLCIVKNNDAGWIRIEPNSGKELKLIKNNLPRGIKIEKSAVDIQPREILILDITKNEKEILAGMKQKTRYNIRLAEKREVKVFSIEYNSSSSAKYFDEFIRLVKITSERDKIKSHPENYYRKMFEVIPPEILKLYVAEYEGIIIAANLVLFFGKTATYMHGASDNEFRNVMAPYLLQWRQIQDARKLGCKRYDFGGVKSYSREQTHNKNNWSGITKFKTGFALETKAVEFPGCYDIILNPAKYKLYRIFQKVKGIF